MDAAIAAIDSSYFSAAVWLSVGIALIIAEFFLPGAISVFLGLGAILTAALTYLGALTTLHAQFLFWVFSSLVLILLLRSRITHWFPSLERYDPRPDEAEIVGRVVETLSDIRPGEKEGRVRFQGSAWAARSVDEPIAAGQKARILGRDNLCLIVEPYHEKNPPRRDDNAPDTSAY